MAKIPASQAEAALATLWRAIFKHPRGKQIVHVLPQDKTGGDLYYLATPYFTRWTKGGPNAYAESLRLLAEVAVGWTYIANANIARILGVSNIRIIILPHNRSEPWQRFICEVFWPFFAAATGEQVIVLDREDYQAAGLPELSHDVNQWGDPILMTRYENSADGDREIVHPRSSRYRGLAELVEAILACAEAHGTVLAPAQLPTAPPA